MPVHVYVSDFGFACRTRPHEHLLDTFLRHGDSFKSYRWGANNSAKGSDHRSPYLEALKIDTQRVCSMENAAAVRFVSLQKAVQPAHAKRHFLTSYPVVKTCIPSQKVDTCRISNGDMCFPFLSLLSDARCRCAPGGPQRGPMHLHFVRTNAGVPS